MEVEEQNKGDARSHRKLNVIDKMASLEAEVKSIVKTASLVDEHCFENIILAYISAQQENKAENWKTGPIEPYYSCLHFKHTSRRRHLTFAPITLSRISNLGELERVRMTMVVKAQSNQPCHAAR